jgi:hypothetical protein
MNDRRIAIAFGVFLAAFGLAAVVIGFHDAALAGAPLGVTAGAVVLIGGGAIDLVAAWALVRLGGGRWPQRVFVAFLLTSLIGAYSFLGAIKTGGDQRPIVAVVTGLLTVVAVLGARIAWREGAGGRIHVAEAVGIALVGGLIGVTEFWYQNQYVPSHVESAVSLHVALKLEAVQKKFDVIRATIAFEDICPASRNLA